ncbi:MAG: alpha/beta hydrolase family protein [Armatimonadota bacterium]
MSTSRESLYSLLGDLPPRDRAVSAELVVEQDRVSYILEILTLDLNGIEPVPAYFVKPKDRSGPRPTILYNHAHGGDYKFGKEELISGRPALQNPPYAEVLTSMGYNALCIDTWCFGHRWGRPESAVFKEMLWRGQVLWGMMVYDSIKSLDYLCTRDDVDKSRIGTLGLSMGSTMAWWTAALDERIACCVDICCLTDFHALIDVRGLDAHGIYYYVPALLKEWTTAKINALIAPRPHLALAGEYDILTPSHGLDRIDAELRKVYEQAGKPEAWKLLRYPCGHLETHAMRQEIIRWLKRWLG